MRSDWQWSRPAGRPGKATGKATGGATGMVMAAGLALAACGPPPPPPPPPVLAHPSKPVFDSATVAANKSMAAGVPIGDSTAPVDTRFDLVAVPVPGEPFLVKVAVMPSAPAPLLRVDVTGAEGLLVLSPEGQVTREKVAAGAILPFEIRAQAGEAGARVLYVKVTLELPEGPQARTFAFPVLVGATAAPAPAPGTPKTAH